MNTEDPLISVVVPSYNSAAFIAETIESILNQTHKKIEIIIVDDGSIDNTQAVIESLYGLDSRISYLKIENGGSPAARNVGIKLAKGQYIAAVDADDIWPEYKLADQLSLIGDDDNTIVLGNIEKFFIGDNGERISGSQVHLPKVSTNYVDTVLSVALEQMVLFNTFLAPAHIIKTFGQWDPEQITAHDWENWIRLARSYRFIHSDKIYQYYRKHQSSTTRKHRPLQALTYQLRAIDLHATYIKSIGLDPKKYKRMRFQNWIDIYLYEKQYLLCLKLLGMGAFSANVVFNFSGLKLLLKTLLGIIRGSGR